MTSMDSQNNSSMVPPQHRRHLRNYLLLKGFQLKYAGLFAGSALLLSLLLGTLLTLTSRDVLRQSQEAVEQGRRAVAMGQQLVQESQKVSAVVGLSVAKSTDYADHPELREAFVADNQALAAKTLQQQQALVRQTTDLGRNALALRERQSSVLITIFGLLGVLVVGLGALGIVFTHKVAGPVFKMKRYLGRIRDGRLSEPAPLRRGDDLRDFFEELCSAVRALRKRETEDLGLLKSAAEKLRGIDPELGARLDARCDEKKRALEG